MHKEKDAMFLEAERQRALIKSQRNWIIRLAGISALLVVAIAVYKKHKFRIRAFLGR
jgi:type IV secretory pathway component VirB8